MQGSGTFTEVGSSIPTMDFMSALEDSTKPQMPAKRVYPAEPKVGADQSHVLRLLNTEIMHK